MRTGPIAALALLSALALAGCVHTTATSTTWGEPYGASWARQGRVESIRETVHHQQGDPAGGAVAGAVVGGLLGHALGGDGIGTLFGAVGGAMVGAGASQGQAESRYYEIFVRFEDGGYETFGYQGAPPFRVGDLVSLTPQGLVRQ